MDRARSLKVLLIAPYFSKSTPGESWSTFKWVEGISQHCDTTVLTTHHHDWDPATSPTNAREIVNWTDPRLPKKFSRLASELKPGYLLFYLRARRWIKKRLKSGWDFDLVHQVNPLAMRYPSPAAGLGLRYIIGPLAGSLDNPPGFKDSATDSQWYRKLRRLDKWRIRHDPWLRRTYHDAALVLGVAPYVQDFLAPAGIKAFEIMAETGVESVATQPIRPPAPGEPLRLLFVGRIIRTKGILEAIQAVAIASKSAHLEFNVVGDGDLLPACRAETARLGINHIVHFHGRRPRSEVSEWYQKSHVFLFPSFREPSGNVVFEAMSHGLPVITSDRGGPGYVVDETCGINISPTTPSEYSANIADFILQISTSNEKIARHSIESLKRIKEIADWEGKTNELALQYAKLKADKNMEVIRR